MSEPAGGERIFSLSVDLDGLGCYAAIHGIDPRGLSERALAAVPVVGLLRLRELFERKGIRATFFAIGAELELPGAAAALAGAARAGHEIGSHSFAHDYALSRLPQGEIEADLARAEESIDRACGVRPRGFRAPGYTLSPALLRALRARGYQYDSSLLPSPPYYLAKAAAIGLHRLRGRRSHSILGGAGQLFGSRGAHLRGGLRELPISTLPGLRAPVFGTVVLGVGEGPAALLSRGAFARPARGGNPANAGNPADAGNPAGAGNPGSGAAIARPAHFNLELHGIDALDDTDGAPPALARLQPGLRLPAADKLRRLSALCDALLARAAPCTLQAAAERLLGG